ncbi:hypothetical protein MSAN_01020000 [Mycena sanguinolenta]|uniref:Uncharacterized protein n=1 Tax=Mycena sanguinolenta TaxID=230812 RepID=A0A8H6YR40_9AGAR|nr:hypothetical protein MSAN_01020000 [Mycena sanguinolenta]
MLDRLPPEIGAHIFDFACRDSGCTGRSLSLVSRYIHQTSELVRYTSIVLVGRAQILAFAQFADHTRIKLNTRHLFINSQESEEELENMLFHADKDERNARRELGRLLGLLSSSDEKVNEARDAVARESAKKDIFLGREVASAVQSILCSLGPTLEILDISVNEYAAKMLLNPISLPRLVDLTTRCGFPLRPNDVPALEPTHSLRYLHIVDTTHQWHYVEHFLENGVSYFAPSLMHLRLSQLQEDEVVVTHLECALGLVRPSKYSAKVTPLPRTIERVLLKAAVAPPPYVGCSCCDDTVAYRSLVQHARLLRDKDYRVLLLNADSTDPPEDLYFQEWRDKADGATCKWDTSDLDLDSA